MNTNFPKTKGMLWISILGLMIVGLANSRGETIPETTKTKKGLRFTVPEDWPVEERAGVVAPISVAEYVTKKFRDIESRLEKIEHDISIELKDAQNERSPAQQDIPRQLQEMNARLESIAQEAAQLKNQGESSGNAASGWKQVESQLNVLDKDMRNEMKLLRTRIEDVERRLRTIEFHLEM